MENNLTEIVIPPSVIHIGAAAFNGNEIIGINGEASNGIIYSRNPDGSEDLTTIVSYGGASSDIDFIPNSVTTIGDKAFIANNLESIGLPGSVITIGIHSFSVNWFDFIIIPQSVVSIAPYAFSLTSLDSVLFEPNSSIEIIGEGAFPDLPFMELPTHANPNFVEYKDANSNTFNPGDSITNFDISYEADILQQTVYYEVAFNDWDGTELKVDSIVEGGLATAPADPTRAGYSFAGWDADFSNVQDNLTVTAQYQSTDVRTMTYVPDDNFEQVLIDKGYDDELNDSVPTANVSSLTYLNIANKGIADLTGIKDFAALQDLICYSNQLSDLDVSNNKALKVLSCYSNQLASLDVSRNTNLEVLWCKSNQLISLDISNNVVLYSLDCAFNQLRTLDVSNNLPLTDIWCQVNQIDTLNVSNNIALINLTCAFNQLSELDVSNNTALKMLGCSSNQLNDLDISNNIVLEKLYCDNNQLNSLNLKNGNNSGISDFNATDNSALTCIEVDDPDAVNSYSGWQKDASANYLVDCITVSENYFAVTFVDWDGTELKKDSVVDGGAVLPPADPMRDGYTFTGWDVTFDNITSDLTVTAQYDANTYTVTFEDWDGSLLKTDRIEYGSTAVAPDNPIRDGYFFTGWDIDFVIITSELAIKAQYVINNPPTAVIESELFAEEGTTIVLNGTKSNDPENNLISFSWSVSNELSNKGVTDSILSLTLPMVNKDTTIVVGLTVNDGELNSDMQEISITIKDIYPAFKLLSMSNGEALDTTAVAYEFFKREGDVYLKKEFVSYDQGDTAIFKVEPGSWIVRGISISDTVAFVTTYIGDTQNWEDATAILINEGEVVFVELNFSVLASNEGDYVVSGYVYQDSTSGKSYIAKSATDNSKIPFSNVQVLLFQQGNETPTKSSKTDENGFYNFSSLAGGNYFIEVDIPGLMQSESYNVTVNSDSPERSVSFVANLGSNVITDATFKHTLDNIIVYPNPTTGMVTLDIPSNSSATTQVVVLSISGSEVLRKEFGITDKLQFDLSNSISGMYFVKIITDNREVVKKLILDKN